MPAASSPQEVGALAGGEPEGVLECVDALGCLAEQDLGGGVGHDGLAEGRSEQVGGVLGDDGEPGPVLAGGLGHAEEELGPRAFGHEQPRLVDEHQTPGRAGGIGDAPPDGVQGEEGAGRFELVGQIAQAEHDEVAVGAGGGRPVEEAPWVPETKGASRPASAWAPGSASASKAAARSRIVGAGRAWLRTSAVMPASS